MKRIGAWNSVPMSGDANGTNLAAPSQNRVAISFFSTSNSTEFFLFPSNDPGAQSQKGFWVALVGAVTVMFTKENHGTLVEQGWKGVSNNGTPIWVLETFEEG